MHNILNGWKMKKFYEWLLETIQNFHIDLSDYESKIKDEIYSYDYEEEDANRYVKELVQKTQENMAEIKNKIQNAINQIPNWTTNTITIQARPSYYGTRVSAEASDFAEIIFGPKENHVSFSLSYHENGIHIDDILEGGDKDFFTNQLMQNDYFTLIDELRNSGKKKKDKILTLYTARPRKDREQLLANKTLPINVFLTDSQEHAEGLAIDLSGGQGTRDIWMVKINSTYLTKTLDGPVKYYQLTKEHAPMEIFLTN